MSDESGRSNFRVDPAELASLVGGTWDTPPHEAWHLGRMNSLRARLRSVRRTKARPDSLFYVESADRDLKRLADSTLDVGRAVLMVGEDAPTVENSAGILRVPDVMAAVRTISEAVRGDYSGQLIAVTGSMGKTTVQTLLSQVLGQHHSVYARRSDVNSIRLTRWRLLELEDQEYAVFEVPRAILPGAEQALCPDVAVVTAIAEAHMEALGSLESTAQRKAELLRGLSPEGTAVINRDVPYAEVLLKNAQERTTHVLTYGVTGEADIRLVSYDADSSTVTADVMGEQLSYGLGATGEHNALNSLAVVGVLRALGLDATRYLEGFAQFRAVQGRGETTEVQLEGRHATIVDQSFNANPASMRAALSDFASQYPDRPRILILGDMKEMGPTSAELHAGLAPDVIASEPTRVYLLGTEMLEVWSRLPEELRGAHAMTAQQLLRLIPGDLEENTAVLLKSSHDTGLYKLVESWKASSESEEGDTETQTWHVRVQGPAVHQVGFRRWIRSVAQSIGLDGWVRNVVANVEEQVVEVLIRGERDDVDHALALLHHGPERASIRSVHDARVETVPAPGFHWQRSVKSRND